jgi:hypothetical protein
MNLLHAPAGLGASLRRIMNASDPAKSTASAIKPHSVRVGTGLLCNALSHASSSVERAKLDPAMTASELALELLRLPQRLSRDQLALTLLSILCQKKQCPVGRTRR